MNVSFWPQGDEQKNKTFTQHYPQYFCPFYHDFVRKCTCKFEKFHKVYENSNEIYLAFLLFIKRIKQIVTEEGCDI